MKTTSPVADNKPAVDIWAIDHQSMVQGEQRIIIAAQGNNINRLQSAITASMDINERDSRGYTALMILADLGHVEGVRLLIENEADLRVKSVEKGYTALMIAANSICLDNKNCAAVVSALIGADPSAEHLDHAGENGVTALMLAVNAGDWELALLLKEAGADINKENRDGFSALSFAAHHGKKDTVEWLLEQKGWFSRAQVEDAINRASSPFVKEAMKDALKEYPGNFNVVALKPAIEQEVSHSAPSVSDQAGHSGINLFVANNPGPNSANAKALQNPDDSKEKKTLFPRMQTGAPADSRPAGSTKRPLSVVPEHETTPPVKTENATASTHKGNPGYEEVRLAPR